MKKISVLSALLICCLTAFAQQFSLPKPIQPVTFPDWGRDLKTTNQPETDLDGLYVGDEGYVTFTLTNIGESVYSGPIYLRLFNMEQSVQVLACSKKKLKPGKVYNLTTVFPTDRLSPYSHYFIGIEYDEDGHTVPMGALEPTPLSSFMLLAPIINNPVRKSPVKAKVKVVKSNKN